MKNVSFKNKLGELKNDLLKTPTPPTLQKVVPVKESKTLKSGSTQISAYIEDDLLDQIKLKCLKEKKKISPLIEDLLKNWIKE